MPPPTDFILSQERTVVFRRLESEQTLQDAVEAFKADHVSDFQENILILQEQNGTKFNVLTWWFTFQEGNERQELFMTVLIDDMDEVRSDICLNVTNPPVEFTELIPTPPSESDPNRGTMVVNVSFTDEQEDYRRLCILVQGTTSNGVPTIFTIDEQINGAFRRDDVPAGEYSLALIKR